MAKELILTMTAANRVGILSAVTRALTDLGCDLRELSQTVVRGYFTMIFLAEFPDELGEDIIQAHINDTCRTFEIDVAIRDPKRDTQSESAEGTSSLHMLRMGGENQPGVLRQLSTVLCVHQADIIGMRAVRLPGGHGFEMVMKISFSGESDIRTLVDDLNRAGELFSMTVDVTNLSR